MHRNWHVYMFLVLIIQGSFLLGSLLIYECTGLIIKVVPIINSMS